MAACSLSESLWVLRCADTAVPLPLVVSVVGGFLQLQGNGANLPKVLVRNVLTLCLSTAMRNAAEIETS